MIEVKLGLALMNKPGWNIWDTNIFPHIPYNRPRRLLGNYIRGPFPMLVKVLEDGDFNDKLLIYRECITLYKEIYSNDLIYKYISLVDIVYQAVSRGDCRGVVVAALYNPRLFSLKGGLANVEIVQENWDLEADGIGASQSARKGRQVGLGQAVLPPADLTVEQQERRLLEAFTEFAEAHPERARGLADQVAQVAVEKRPPSEERTLGLTEAARLISAARGAKLHPTQLRRYFDDPDIKIGAPGPDGEPRFSEYECEQFIPPDRGRGRPKKSATEPLE